MRWPSRVTAVLFSTLLSSPIFAQEKVTFPSTDADLKGGTPTTITGYLYKPEGAGPFSAVIGMHGCDGLKGSDGSISPFYGAWGDRLSKQGIVVLLLDVFGSRGHGDLCSVPVASRPIQSTREPPRDAYGALAYLQSRSDVKSQQIALFGQSYGASVTLSTVAQDSAQKPPAEKDFRAAVVLYPTCQPFLTREPKWQPRVPLLLLMGEADTFSPVANCKALAERLEKDGAKIEARFYPDAHHAFDHPINHVRVLTHIKRPDGSSPSAGAHPEARADAEVRVARFLKSLPE